MFPHTVCTKGQSHIGRKGQHCFGLEFPEVKVGYALVIVLEHDVAVFGASDERAPVAGGIVYHGAKLLELLQRDDRCHSALVEPHLFEISEQTTQVHPARSCIAVADEPTRLLLQVREADA